MSSSSVQFSSVLTIGLDVTTVRGGEEEERGLERLAGKVFGNLFQYSTPLLVLVAMTLNTFLRFDITLIS